MGKRKKKQPRLVDHLSDDSDDEEIPEDEAFNSDDERKYGSFFAKSGEQNDSEEEENSQDEESDDDDDDDGLASEDDDSEEGDGGRYMLDLLDKLDGENTSAKDDNCKSKSSAIAAHTKESEFSSSVVPKAGLTLDSLMKGLEDTKGFGVMQKTMKKVAQGQATAAPLARVVSDRAQRKVHYEDQSKEVSLWLDAVRENRQAETLDFRPKERMEVTRDVLVDKFVPTTDFEKQIHEALQQAGQEDEDALLKTEEAALQDDLGANEISLEEYKKRRGQLAKMRALMFYHEQKRHHINKIKSKKYRRIRKKQRERQKEAEVQAEMEENPDLAAELEEKEEMERMKERMTLAHKNTSKWAKRILKRGKNVDVDTRRALSAQLKRGDDLLKRMKTTRAAEEEDDDSEEEDLIETAKKVLADTENDGEEPVKGEGLFKLSFMQRGVERQRERAREEARQLLLELEANERLEQEFDDNGDEETEFPDGKKKAKVASKEEMKQVLKEGDLVASSLKFGNSDSIAVSGGINIDVDVSLSKNGDKQAASSGAVKEHSALLSVSVPSDSDTKKKSASKELSSESSRKMKQKASTPIIQASDKDSNPWLAGEPSKDATTTAGIGKKSKTPPANRTGMVDLERVIDLVQGSAENDATSKRKSNEDAAPADEKKITTLTQEELIRRAFAATSDKEVEEEFAKEKEAIEEQEDPTRKQKKEKDMGKVAGWGSWAGKGAPPPRPPRKLPKHLRPPEKKHPKRKRQDEKKPNVIISEKRVKRTADNYMVAQIPYPFTSREEYERAMAGGLGREWNVTNSFKDMTRPEIMTRAGKMIQPLSKRVKQKRPAAKF